MPGFWEIVFSPRMMGKFLAGLLMGVFAALSSSTLLALSVEWDTAAAATVAPLIVLAVVLALGLVDDPEAVRQRQTCLDIIVRGQAPSGGWGAYVTTATEPFDTAVVVLALADLLEAPGLAAPTVDERAGLERLIAAGRSFLLAEQLDDGSWVETTRPPGQQSYAQYISTSGWATLALLATRDPG